MTQQQLKYPAYLPGLICFCGSLFFFYEFIQMNMLNSLGVYLVKEFSINATQLGVLSSWYFYANLMCIPLAGILLDRISTRKVIIYAMIICTLGTLLFSNSHSLSLLATCRFFTGMGSAFCLLSAVRLASRWFAPRRMALITGFVVTMAMLGGVVAQTPMTLLAELMGWRHALWVDTGLGVLIILLITIFVRDYPPGAHANHRQEQQALKEIGFWQAKKIAFGGYRNWLAGLFTCFLNLPISLLGALWGNTYLQAVYHLSATNASYVTSMIFLGTVFGSPTAGWISDRIGLRKLPMLIGGIFSLMITLLLIFVTNMTTTELVVLFLLLGFFSSAQIISYPLVSELSPRILTATSVSVVSFTCIAGYAVFQPLFGRIMDAHWNGHLVNGIRIYAASDYRFAIWILPAAFLIAIFSVFFLKESYCRSE
jgi:MFS family permease